MARGDGAPCRRTLDEAGLEALVAALVADGRRVVGPAVREGAVVLDTLRRAAELPWGWTESQEPGAYRVRRDPDAGAFTHTVGPQAWKRYLFPPREVLFRARREGAGLRIEAPAEEEAPLALLGVRSCDLHAIAVQDRVFIGGPYVEPGYARRRASALVVAVQCGRSAATCFCASMDTGPRADAGFDLALTELRAPGGGWRYVVEVGSEAGARLLAALPAGDASAADEAAARAATDAAAAAQVRRMAPDAAALLLAAFEHPHWNDVAARCLACANCTLVCPTCFCSTVEDVTDLEGAAERARRWDSCFTADFSHVVGGPVRASTRSRYRQWITHKLGTWHEQFGTSGCVGCGRCLTWCPVGIDITREVEGLRAPRRKEVTDGD